MVSKRGGSVYLQRNSDSRLLRNLPRGAIVTSTAEAGSEGRVAYYRVQTLSGIEGWIKRWDVKEITVHEAGRLRLRHQQAFEQSLQDTILAAVAAEIESQGIHTLSNIESSWITGEVAADSSTSSVDVEVTTIMWGAILGQDKYQVDSRVSVFLLVDRDHLPASTFEVNRVVVLGDEKIRGMPLKETIGLFKLIGPLFGLPLIP
jgi:hypothetical protein